MPVCCVLVRSLVERARDSRQRNSSVVRRLTTWALSFWSSASSLKLKSIMVALFGSKIRFVVCGWIDRALAELAVLTRQLFC